MELQSGIATVGSSSTKLKRITINFPAPFDSVPVLVATTLQGTDYPGEIPDVFAVTAKSVTSTQAVVQVQRVDAANGWAQNLRLNWIASK